MVRIQDIIDLADLEREIHAGYINRRFHPEFPQLAIINYSDRAQFDGHWTPTTIAARGIIYDTARAGLVLARPFGKMFNYGDTDRTGDLDPDMKIRGAYNKWDGSLGILYLRPDGVQAMATRGSFDSDQARHASEIVKTWRTSYTFDTGFTSLFEIIYPDNRIVLDYGDRDDLVYLGDVDNATGAFYPFGTRDDIAGGTSLRTVLSLPPRPNAEGWVIWLDGTHAVKVKQDDYLALHRIVSNLTVKEVWRQLRAGTFESFATALPDEFHLWARETAEELFISFEYLDTDGEYWWREVLEQELPTRKEQALWVTANVPADRRGLVFSRLDGKPTDDAVWRMVEPKGNQPMRGLVDA